MKKAKLLALLLSIIMVMSVVLTSCSGTQGEQGIQGIQGEKGDKGDIGASGAQGEKGDKGDKGDNGAIGAVGPQGPQGATGATGPQGPQGATGATGPQGPQGATGATGSQGAQGTPGATGPQGPQGETGAQGDKGDKGDTGETGKVGFIVTTNEQFKLVVENVANAYIIVAVADLAPEASVIEGSTTVVNCNGNSIDISGIVNSDRLTIVNVGDVTSKDTVSTDADDKLTAPIEVVLPNVGGLEAAPTLSLPIGTQLTDGATDIKTTITVLPDPDVHGGNGLTIAEGACIVGFEVNVNGLATENTALLTMTFNIGIGREGVVVYHDGAAMIISDGTQEGYKYDEDTGIVTVWTKSFSPFSIAYFNIEDTVAMIGDNRYYSIHAALDAAKDGDTVVLLKDITLTEAQANLYIRADITFDGNGKTITIVYNDVQSDGYSYTPSIVVDAATVTIKNVNFAGLVNGSKDDSAIYVSNNAFLTVIDCTFTGGNNSGVTGIISDGSENNVVVVENCTFTSLKYAIYLNAVNDGVINGNTVNGTQYNAFNVVNGNATIKNNVLTNIATADESNTWGHKYNSGICSQGAALTLENNSITMYQEGDMDIYIPNAKIGNVYYLFEEAVAAVKEGETIEILKAGEYAPFTITAANVTVKGFVGATKEESTVIVNTATDNIRAYANNITLDGLWIDSSAEQSIYWPQSGAVSAYISTDSGAHANDLTVKNCKIVGGGSGYAFFFCGKGLTVDNCDIENFETGFGAMCDNTAADDIIFTNNTLTNVPKVFDGYWGNAIDGDFNGKVVIEGNTFVGEKATIIRIWDYAQYCGKNAAVAVSVKNNVGAADIYLTHFNYKQSNEVDVVAGDGQKVIYESVVVFNLTEADGNKADYTIMNADGSALNYYESCTTLGTMVSNKPAVYHLPAGDYVLVSSKHSLKYAFTVTEPVVGTTQTVSLDTVAIGTQEELFAFANAVNVDQKTNFKYVVLTADIDLENKPWTPIGQTGAKQFFGIFDGAGHTIFNLNIDSSAQTGDNYSSGLFGWIERTGNDADYLMAVKNLTIDGATVTGHHNVAVIAGYLIGTIENCHVINATVTCTHANDDACGDKAGVIVGIAGEANAKVEECSATDCTVTAGRDAGQIVGAFTTNPSNVINCKADNVTVSSTGDCTGANINNALIGRTN